MRMPSRLWCCVPLLAVLMGGCADPALDELTVTLSEKRHFTDKPPNVEIPDIPEYEPVAYAHAEQRSPFMAPEELERRMITKTFDSELAPDPSRQREPLESYPLPELELVGTMRMGGRHSALIKNPQGEIVAVREGNFMGINYGRIEQIEPDRLVVVERLFSPRDGWQKHSVSLSLPEKKGAL